MNTTPLVIGAYAALPATRADQEAFYDRLHTDLGATGLELPFRDNIHDDPRGSPANSQDGSPAPSSPRSPAP
nr:DUF4862 family protein [Corynebacterium belfantii]